MHELLNYILCVTSFILLLLFFIYFKRNIIIEKILLISDVLHNNHLTIADLGSSFNLIFIDAESEQKFLSDANTYDLNRKSIIFYRAPEYRVKLFERKIPDNMILCGDFENELNEILDIKEYPSLVELNYFKKTIKKIY